MTTHVSHFFDLLNLDGTGERRTLVYRLPSLDEHNFWVSVTDIDCPAPRCNGVLRWAEGGYVPGYRICDRCGRHFLARGNALDPRLAQVPGRRRGPVFNMIRRAVTV